MYKDAERRTMKNAHLRDNHLVEPEELAARWKMTPLTLAQWRWKKKGPNYLRMGRYTFYRYEDIIAYEEKQSRQSTTNTVEEQISKGLYRKKISIMEKKMT
jgi:hypothetical protein